MKHIFPFLAVLVVFVSCNLSKTESSPSDAIRLNQLGFYPNATKQFLLADLECDSFEIIGDDDEVKYQGVLVPQGTWKASGEHVLLGDFSDVTKEGTYRILVDGKIQSHTFEIKKNLYAEALTASVKSFYFQRASMELEETYAGRYQRAAGHPDDGCLMHPSTGKTEGTWNGSGGWYDAGDYGKYVVNAALSVGQMLTFAEKFPTVFKDGSLNIPESGNGHSDLLDELKYELDWILKMQDDDGGVFFKLTAKQFGGFIMPSEYDLERYVIGKGTASTLNFAAVLAQASRIYSHDKMWSSHALEASKKAWNWAVNNPDIPFKNPEDVATGEYGDTYFEDDFFWAATELFLVTGEEEYFDYLIGNPVPVTHVLHDSWKNFVRNNAFHSLLLNRDKVAKEFIEDLEDQHLEIAIRILAEIEASPYRIGLNDFVWGSSSDILNQAYILCVAHQVSGEEKYLKGAVQMTDYIFGKNATGYSFLTGFGDRLVVNPHHRPSASDDIPGAIPGFVIGGPNGHKQDAASVDYASDFPAKSFEDVVESFASNEVCLNWNAPAVFVLGYLELHKN